MESMLQDVRPGDLVRLTDGSKVIITTTATAWAGSLVAEAQTVGPADVVVTEKTFAHILTRVSRDLE